MRDSSSCKLVHISDNATQNLTNVVVDADLVFTYYSNQICDGVCNIHNNKDTVRIGSKSCLDEIRCNGLSYFSLFPNASLDMMFDIMWYNNFWSAAPRKRSVDHLIESFNVSDSYCIRSDVDWVVTKFYLFNGSRCFPFQFELSNDILVILTA